jgi:glycosyltransferase involved in cell wall biosynthesis
MTGKPKGATIVDSVRVPTSPQNSATTGIPVKTATQVFIDLTHLGRHVTGIERVSIEQFEKVEFADARVTYVRAQGIVSLIFRQQIWLPLLALLNPHALFVFPGFAPSPLFVFARKRVIMYVHDLFLITRRAELATKAKVYMAWPFAVAVSRLVRFQVNSQKTADELAPFVRSDAVISLYRPSVRNVFALDVGDRENRDTKPQPLVIATLGTVEPRKNYSAALALLDALTGIGIAAQLHIIGREGWGEAKAALVAHSSVTIHGYLPAANVKALLEAADLYLCTSHDEGLGLPLLEAQYAGLAVVAPDKVVFHEVLGKSAIFIDTADATAAAAQVANLIAQPDWRAHTTASALANVARWNALAANDASEARTMFCSSSAD